MPSKKKKKRGWRTKRQVRSVADLVLSVDVTLDGQRVTALPYSTESQPLRPPAQTSAGKIMLGRLYQRLADEE